MNFTGIFAPVPALTEEARSKGLRMVTWQAVASSGADGATSGGILAAYALALGASNFQIGVLTALPFLMQPLQIAVVALIESRRRRKIFAVTANFVAFSVWIPVAAIPILMGTPSAAAVSALLAFVALRGAANALFNCSWNSWLRDILPRESMGAFFAQRLRYSTLMAAAVGLVAALFIDFWKGDAPAGREILGYSLAMLFGAVVLGWSAVGFLSRIPEPRMEAAPTERVPLFLTLAIPFRDRNFRQLVNFLLLWNLVSHLAVPFFTVYMLVRLGLPLSAVVGFIVLSQLSNVVFLRVWGPLVDRFGSKVVLSLASSLYLLVIIGWAFTTLPERYFMTIPLLVVLHVLVGAAAAGVNVSNTTIRMKLAPRENATAYLTAASLAANLGAGVGPLVGGLLADFFAQRQLTVTFTWIDPARTVDLPAINLAGFDFLFAVAFGTGLLVLNMLTTIEEEGEADRKMVLDEMLGPARDQLRLASSLPGIGLLSYFPYRSVPGMDVALGVTAYEIASSSRSAVAAVARGSAAAKDAAERIGDAVTELMDQVGRAGAAGEQYASELSQHVVRGAFHAVNDVAVDVGQLIEGSVSGIAKAFADSPAALRAAMRGLGYGSVQGAKEAGADPIDAVSRTVDSARRAAGSLPISEEEAAREAAIGAIKAAADAGPETAGQIADALAGQGIDMEPGQADRRTD